jgi:chemosensory pili system protein ChpC
MTTAAAVANEPSELSCILIPLRDAQLLLPSVCVAEIMPWRRIKTLQEVPAWCLGLLGWRGESVPVVHFESLNESQGQQGAPGRCLVVMNRTGSGASPFYALVAEGLPRLLQLSDDDISDDEQRAGAAEARIVRVGTETASIPDLAFLESQVAALPLRK